MCEKATRGVLFSPAVGGGDEISDFGCKAVCEKATVAAVMAIFLLTFCRRFDKMALTFSKYVNDSIFIAPSHECKGAISLLFLLISV